VLKESFLGRRVSSQVQGAIHVSLERIQVRRGCTLTSLANHVQLITLATLALQHVSPVNLARSLKKEVPNAQNAMQEKRAQA
jgi:hypothetical protein